MVPTTRGQKQRICELDKGKSPHVAEVDKVGEDAEHGREKRKAIDDTKDELQDHDGVDELGQESLRDHGMFFDELGEVV